jgi:hypothetical protein
VLSFNNILTTEGLNSLTFGDSYARLCFMTMLVRAAAASRRSSQNKAPKRVIYIDTDTTFTAYLMAGFILNGYDMYPDRKNSQPQLSSSTNAMFADRRRKTNNNIESKQSQDDNTFSCNDNADFRLVQVFLPSEGRFESLLGEAIASMKEGSIVILDSLNSFYNMYPTSYQDPGITGQSLREKGEQTQKNDISPSTAAPSHPPGQDVSKDEKPKKSPYTINRLNHLLSVFIMLLVKHGVYFDIPILVTSMVRYKKVSEGLWVKSPTCRRLLHQKSVVRLSVEMSGDKDLSVNIMKHPTIAQQTIVYPNAGISLSS